MKFFILALLVLLGAALLWQSRRLRRQSGLPRGRVIYSDTSGWQKVERPLYDAELGLTGRPDYIVRQPDGLLIPVEVKSSRTPKTPYDSHLYQLAAYCLLVARQSGRRPPYGLIKYPEKTFTVPYTQALEDNLLALLDEIRACQTPHRSHTSPNRCAACGYRKICDESLA